MKQLETLSKTYSDQLNQTMAEIQQATNTLNMLNQRREQLRGAIFALDELNANLAKPADAAAGADAASGTDAAQTEQKAEGEKTVDAAAEAGATEVATSKKAAKAKKEAAVVETEVK